MLPYRGLSACQKQHYSLLAQSVAGCNRALCAVMVLGFPSEDGTRTTALLRHQSAAGDFTVNLGEHPATMAISPTLSEATERCAATIVTDIHARPMVRMGGYLLGRR